MLPFEANTHQQAQVQETAANKYHVCRLGGVSYSDDVNFGVNETLADSDF